jgi:hypothetical protein
VQRLQQRDIVANLTNIEITKNNLLTIFVVFSYIKFDCIGTSIRNLIYSDNND